MDLNGTFSVHNASDDREQFLNRRFQPDASNEYNLKKRTSSRSRDDDEDEDDDRGPFGGGGRGGGRR